jgi:hypothetical protein
MSGVHFWRRGLLVAVGWLLAGLSVIGAADATWKWVAIGGSNPLGKEARMRRKLWDGFILVSTIVAAVLPLLAVAFVAPLPRARVAPS